MNSRKILLHSASTACLLLAATATLHADGATSRGSLYRNGVYETAGLTSEPKVAWTFQAGAAVRSAPVFYKDRIYVGSLDGHFYCLDAGTGKEVWKVPAAEPLVGGFEGSACIKNGVVYFGAVDGTIFAVDAASGEERWRKKAGKEVFSTPAVAYETVFFFTDGRALGFDIHNGKKVWRAQKSQAPPNRVAVTLDPDFLYYAVKDAFGLMQVNLENEKAVRFQTSGMYSRSTVAMNDTHIAVTNAGNIGGAPGYPGITVFDRSTMQPTFPPRFIEEHLEPGERLPTYSSPGLFEGLVFIGMDSGFFYAIDAVSGETKWTFKAGPFRSSPSISAPDNTLYVGSKDGNLYALDALTGAKRWAFPTGSMVFSDPVVHDGRVFVGNEAGQVICLGRP